MSPSLFRTRLAVLVLCAGTPLAAPAQAPSADAHAQAAQELPVRRITLYRSGVGSFERRGVVGADGRILLRVRTEQVNDILKSMVVLDLSGRGRIDNVAYGSREPIGRRLAGFGVDISDNPTAATLLDRLKGSPVRVRLPEGDVSGVIMNVEHRPTVYAGQGQQNAAKFDLPWINLLTDSGVRSVNLTLASGFELLDHGLAGELRKALEVLAEHRADRTKTVEIVTSGPAGRDIHVGYIHEMPVWKVSYRLVLPDLDAAAKAGQGSIQGWAIVENTTDSDWVDVRLSLVSGRPVSFTMDLYQPLYIERPNLPVPQVAAALPRMYEAGVPAAPQPLAMDARSVARARIAESESAEAPAPGRPRTGKAMDRFDRDLSGEDLAHYAAHAAALARESGEVFQFEVQAPVTIERQHSAMLPIINQETVLRRVSIYNRADGGEHPMRGVDLTNSTGLQLLPGPVAVYDGPVYAGDAQIGHVSPGDSRLLSYAVDLETAVLVKDESAVEVRRLRIVNGVVEQTQQFRRTVTYEFTSKDPARGRTIIVEHPRDGSMSLVKPEKPARETPAHYRFELALEPGKKSSLPVIEERTDHVSLTLLDFDHPTLLRYQREGKASESVLKAFQEGQQKRAAISDAERRLAELERERAAIAEDQTRIRANMGSIDRNSQLYARYMEKLTQQESRMEDLVALIARARDEVTRLRQDLAGFISRLNVD